MLIRHAIATLLLAGSTLPALADPPKDDAVLGGPKVQELEVPATRRTFDGKPNPGKYATPELPMTRYMQVLRDTLGTSAPASARLTDEQSSKIKEAERGFMDAQRKFLSEHAEELSKLRKDAKGKTKADAGKSADANAKANPNAKPDPNMMPDPNTMEDQAKRPGDAKATAERAKKMRENAPKPAEVQARIWSILTPEQQGLLKPKLDAAQEEIAKQRGEREAERRVERQLKEREAKEAKGETVPDKKRIDRAVQKFDNASPETKEAMKAKFRERYQNLTPEQKERLKAKLKEQGIDPDKLEKDDK